MYPVHIAFVLCSSLVLVTARQSLLSPQRQLSESERTINLPLGTVRGSACPLFSESTQFLGIPYAAPMLGSMRYRPSVMYNTSYPVEGLDATNIPAPCGSYCGSGAGAGEDTSFSSEDCLFLNVWVPKTAVPGLAKLPVRVYIHGGSIVGCSASDPQWNGCAHVSKANVIQVNVQFRMGVFGMLAHPSTFDESNSTGNWGLMDQQLALKWVQEHIHYFGGDKSKVVLNGHSSGGQAVDFQMVIPSSQGLFRAAISQSPPCAHFLTLDQAYIVSNEFTLRVGCKSDSGNLTAELDCLRSLSWEKLMAVTRLVGEERPRDILMCDRANWRPFFHHVVDSTFVPLQVTEALLKGEFNRVPYMTGVTTSEASTFIETYYTENVTDGAFSELLEEVYPGADPVSILSMYPSYLYKDAPNPAKAKLNALWTDVFFTCPVHERLEARLVNSISAAPSYLYMWGATPTCPTDRTWLGPSHAVDLWFTFGIVENIPDQSAASGACNLQSDEVALSNTLINVYKAMAESGTPTFNGSTWAEWDPVIQRGTYINTGGIVTRVLDFKSRCSLLLQAKIRSRMLNMSM